MRWIIALVGMMVVSTSALAAEVEGDAAKRAVEKGLSYIQAEDTRWNAIKDICSSCHEGVMSVVTYAEAKKRGYAINEKLYAETLAMAKKRFTPDYEEMPPIQDGQQIPSLAVPLLTLAAEIQPDLLSPTDLDKMAKFALARQEPDGGWPLQPRPPAPVFDSRETFVTWIYLGLEPSQPKDEREASPVRLAREKARTWLESRPIADTSQDAFLRLLVATRDGKKRAIDAAVDRLLKRQNPDGGWSQTPELGSDAYSTGQSLYALNLAGVKPKRKAVQAAVKFLVDTQLSDGSWKMIPRSTPARPVASKNLYPIRFFGATWGTIGLMRSIPE